MEPRALRVGRAILAIAACAGLLSPLLGQGREPAVAPESEESQEQERLWRVVAEEMELAELLDACVGILSLDLVYDRQQVEGRVRLKLSAGLTEEELWTLANRALLGKGLACVQLPGARALSIVSLEQAKSLARLEAPDLDGARAGYVKVLVPLRAPKAAGALVEMVRAALSKEGGVLTSLSEGGALLISDLRPHVEQALEIVRRLDGAQVDTTVVEEVTVQNLPALRLAALLKTIQEARKVVAAEPRRGEVIAKPDGSSVLVIAPIDELAYWRAQIERFDRREPVVTRDYTPRRFGVSETAALIERVVRQEAIAEAAGSWRVVVDELTGTLIITATPSNHEAIAALLARLEGTEWERRTVRTFPVRNRGVTELLAMLEGFLESDALVGPTAATPPTSSSAAAAAQPVQGPTAPLTNQPRTGALAARDTAPELTLAADEGTNRIVAAGEPRMLEELGRLIESLDVRHTQVLVEALVVSLSETEAFDLGVELQKLAVEDDVQFQLASLFGLGSPAASAAVIPPATGTGFGGVVLDPGSFSGIVRALEVLTKGRSLTIPRLVVNNNQEATLGSLLQSPFVSTNASDTVATTSFGGTQDAGTEIVVKPQIAEGDRLILDYSVSISSFVGDSADPALPPPRQENRVQSIVTVPDGYTVVVGGLDVESETEATSRVPIAGELPLIGALFRNRSVTHERRRFFVFLRASVLRGEGFEELRWVSEEPLRAAALDDGWPRVEPRVIR